MALVIVQNFGGRDDDFALDVLVAEGGGDVLVADLLAELLERHAPGLQRFHERHAVAELFVDAVLHDFIHRAVRQLVAFRVEAVQNELAFDQLIEAVVEQFVELLLEDLGLRGVLHAAARSRRRGRNPPPRRR